LKRTVVVPVFAQFLVCLYLMVSSSVIGGAGNRPAGKPDISEMQYGVKEQGDAAVEVLLIFE
jgi:hypothetical protein